MTFRNIRGLRTLLVAATMLAAVPLAQAAPQEQPITLSGKAAVIVLPAGAEGPVRKAAADLAEDMRKVFGAAPRIVEGVAGTMPAGAIEIASPTGGSAESFAIAAREGHVVLSGADMRGTIYAIYQFSQEFLGVDPMYYWTDREPMRRKAVSVPATLAKSYAPPLFEYRGLFINDEDQLTGWAPGERTDGSGISLAVMDKIYETILRLKGNMVAPGSWIFPGDPQVKAAGDRGLILNQHHATPLGTNVARWPANVPYNFSAHPEILKRAWTNTVHEYRPGQEILWSVGLRGLSDTPYSSTDPSVLGNDKLQGQRVTEAIEAQMQIVRSVDKDAKFITNLWQEGARMMNAGYLSIPGDVGHVWADRGYGLIQDKGAVKKGDGLYYHVSMLNGKGANQLSEMVPVDRIYSEVGRFVNAGATHFLLLNTSDLRAVTMSTRAVMDIAWRGLPADAKAGDHYMAWATEQFGSKAAPDIAKVYEQYYKAFSHLPGGDEYGDQLYHEEARQLILSATIAPPYFLLPGQSPKWEPAHTLGLGLEPNFWRQIPEDYVEKTIARELVNCEEAAIRWDAVWKAALAAESKVDPARRDYYRYGVLTMIAVNRNGNAMLLNLSRAIRDYRAGDTAKARAEAVAALAQLSELKKLQDGSEYGKWKHWWRGDWLVGIEQTRQSLEYLIRWIDDPMTLPVAPVVANNWHGYYQIMRYEGARSVDVR